MVGLIIFGLSETGLSQQYPAQEVVILLHGILDPAFVMKRIEWALKKEDYQVINWSYPSRSRTIEEHANQLHALIIDMPPGQKIHFVGFSLGALVVRCYLKNHKLENVGRFVLIAPPNRGSERLDHLYRYSWFRWIYGNKAAQQLLTKNQDSLAKYGVPPCQFGILVGGKGNLEGYNQLLPGDDDGSVSEASTKLEGAKSYKKLRHRHTFLLFSKQTSQEVVSFINTGKFLDEPHSVNIEK